MSPCTLTAGYLPSGAPDGVGWHTTVFEAHGRQVVVRSPELVPQQLEAVAREVRASAQTTLAAMPVADVVCAVDRAVARWLDPNDPVRQEANRVLPVITGFDPEMVRLGLNAFLKSFRQTQLWRFLSEDLGDPGLLDGFRPRAKGGWSRVYGPGLLAHVWAGNVPALPLWSLICGLLVKAGSVGKVASAEPWFAGAFAQTLAEVEPRLAGAMAVVHWPRGQSGLERTLCREADVVMAYGSDEALAAWQQKVPSSTRFLPHGHKLSLGMVSASALDARVADGVARQTALDVARWDQQGCYAPQVLYAARGGAVSPHEFAQRLAAQLQALSTKWPRRVLSVHEAAGVAAWRQGWAMAAWAAVDPAPGAGNLGGGAPQVLGDAAAPWTVVYVDGPAPLAPGPLHRSVVVVGVDRLADAVSCLHAWRPHLQTVGLAASPEELVSLSPLLGAAGVTRICALGAMSAPAPGWHHDGRYSLLDLVRVVDVEASAETAAEAFAAYRD